jgi:hypothetical protein
MPYEQHLIRRTWHRDAMENAVTWTDVAQVALVAGQLGVLVVAAIFAWRQVKEARVLREEQNRPFVVVDFDCEQGYMMYLEVVNMGTSLARDVSIEIDPPLESAIDIEVGKLKMLNEGIATLAPGKRYRTFFDMGFRRAEAEHDYTMNHTAQVRYKDEKGKRTFDETLNLDMDQYMHMNTITRRGIHDVHKQLEAIQKTLKGWSANIGRGMVAMSHAEEKAREDEIVKRMEERRRDDDETAPGDSDGE